MVKGGFMRGNIGFLDGKRGLYEKCIGLFWGGKRGQLQRCFGFSLGGR